MLLRELYVVALKLLMELVDIWNGKVVDVAPVLLAKLDGLLALLYRMMKRTNLCFIAAELVTVNSLILVRVVKSFHCGVAFWAL